MGRVLIRIAIIVAAFSLVVFVSTKIKNKIDDDKWENNIAVAAFNDNKETYNGNFLRLGFQAKEDNIASNMNIFLENKKVEIQNKILSVNNRYYFSAEDIARNFNMQLETYDNEIHFYKVDKNFRKNDEKEIIIDCKNDTYRISGENDLRNSPLKVNNNFYISLIDIAEIFNLRTKWNYETKEIKLYSDRNKLSREPKRQRQKRPALIRFEDVAAGEVYRSSDSLQKMRIIADFMYSQRAPFHVAWIPRYKNPKEGIDNDLLKVDSMANADFIYTLDYMIKRGAIIGLHGYTHQYGEEQSIANAEFGDYATLQETESRVKAAINTAKELNIPYEFFESPHYKSTEAQQKIFEKYFNYMFEPQKGVFNTKPVLSKRNNRTVYVPAPLGYVHDNDVDDMIKRIKAKGKDSIGAFFYHPTKEFESITLLKNNDDYPDYEYSSSSMLHKMIKCLKDEGYAPVKIHDIKLLK